MADKDLKKKNKAKTADVAPENAVKAAEAVQETAEKAAENAVQAAESAENTVQAAEGAENTAEAAADAIKDIKVRVSDDDAKEEKKYTRKELKALEKERKERMKQYHISNMEILKNYKTYGDAEKKHYRYIFGRRIAAKVWPVFRFLILFGLGFVILYPILFMISCAFRPQSEMNDPSVMWIPKNFIFSNIQEVWSYINYPQLMWNTLSVNLLCSLFQVITCSITGYGFARFNFKFKKLLFGIVILQIIVPVQIILIPQFTQFRYFDIFGIIGALSPANPNGLNLTNSPWALYLQAIFVNGIRAGLFILLFRQFFRGLPKELEDAAHLDGCGPFKTFIRIMVPNAKTSFLTVFIFSLVWYWNDSYVSGMFYSESNTISLQIQNIQYTISAARNGGTPQGVASDYMVWIEAGCLLALLPILIIYAFLQKQFVEGIERSGITGM
ncbi:MAG: ABC transporter permease subunit [Firmicutes bacterium]|nr:ABC transporter permease subunit [[Eubacterium] siraeum]MCM1487504.1 ABC transporter permease subunit [Bacillota bacterium]